jgi:hypothetical protein
MTARKKVHSLGPWQVGCNQLFYFAAASGTSHSPFRVLGTFRLLYLCPIGLTPCTGDFSETHLRDQATFRSSPTQEDAAKDGEDQRAFARGVIYLAGQSASALVKELFQTPDPAPLKRLRE